MSLRQKLEAIDAARPATQRYSRTQYIERYGKHPGGAVIDAQERFFEALVARIEWLEGELERLKGETACSGQ